MRKIEGKGGLQECVGKRNRRVSTRLERAEAPTSLGLGPRESMVFERDTKRGIRCDETCSVIELIAAAVESRDELAVGLLRLVRLFLRPSGVNGVCEGSFQL